VHDDLAHVLEHTDVDEPSGTWIGLARRDHELALEGDVDNVTLRHLAADGKIADLVWEAPEELAAEHLQAFQAAMQAYHAGDSESAEQHWQQLRAIWSRAWAADYAALELLLPHLATATCVSSSAASNTGLAKDSPSRQTRGGHAAPSMNWRHRCPLRSELPFTPVIPAPRTKVSAASSREHRSALLAPHGQNP
jgi:hypothetical protein